MSEIFSLANLWTVIKLLSLPAVLKLYIFTQSLHIYGIYILFKNKEDVYKHSIFNQLDKLYTDQELFNKIKDSARREIFKDIFKIEISSINETLLGYRDIIYLHDKLFKFLYFHRYLENKNNIDLFLRLYDAHRDKIEKKIFSKLIGNGLDKARAKYVIHKYYEFTSESSFLFKKKMEILKTRKNIFFSVMDMFDEIEMIVETNKHYLPIKFASLNGRLDGITYKGYRSHTETKNKIISLTKKDLI